MCSTSHKMIIIFTDENQIYNFEERDLEYISTLSAFTNYHLISVISKILVFTQQFITKN